MKVESGALLGEYTLTNRFMRQSSSDNRIELAGKIVSLELISHIRTEARSGVGGAAAGAVLGFLVAGPVGTVVGAGAGREKTRQNEAESYRVRIVVDGHYTPSIMAIVSAGELAKLYDFKAPSPEQIAADAHKTEQEKIAAERKEIADAEAAKARRAEQAELQAEEARDCGKFGITVAQWNYISDLSVDDRFENEDHDEWTKAVCSEAAASCNISMYKAKRILSYQLVGDDDLERFEFLPEGESSPIEVDPNVYDRIVATYCAVGDLSRNGKSAIREISGTEGLPRECVAAILNDASVLKST